MAFQASDAEAKVNIKGPGSWFGYKSHQPIQVRNDDPHDSMHKDDDGQRDMAQAFEIMHASTAGPSDLPLATSTSPCSAAKLQAGRGDDSQQCHEPSCPEALWSQCSQQQQDQHQHQHQQPQKIYKNVYSSKGVADTETYPCPTPPPATVSTTMATMINPPKTAHEPLFTYGAMMMDKLKDAAHGSWRQAAHNEWEYVKDWVKATMPHLNDELLFDEESGSAVDDDEDEGEVVFDESQVENMMHLQGNSEGQEIYGHPEDDESTNGTPRTGFFYNTRRGDVVLPPHAHKQDKEYGPENEINDRNEDQNAEGQRFRFLPVFNKLKRGLPKIWEFGHHRAEHTSEQEESHADKAQPSPEKNVDEHMFRTLPIEPKKRGSEGSHEKRKTQEEERPMSNILLVDRLKRALPNIWHFGGYSKQNDISHVCDDGDDGDNSDGSGFDENDYEDEDKDDEDKDDEDEDEVDDEKGGIRDRSIISRILRYLPGYWSHGDDYRASSTPEKGSHHDYTSEAKRLLLQKKRDLEHAAASRAADAVHHAQDAAASMAADTVHHAQQKVSGWKQQHYQHAHDKKQQKRADKLRRKAEKELNKKIASEQQHYDAQLSNLEAKSAQEALKKARKADEKAAKERQGQQAAINKKSASRIKALKREIELESQKHDAAIKKAQGKMAKEEADVAAKKKAADEEADEAMKKRQEQMERAAAKSVEREQIEIKKRQEAFEKRESKLSRDIVDKLRKQE
ncbi:hypothetical protein EDD11_008397 [Mortierella claussenii]|nr:hypothetical protein EDD11_008397 [Mortierella claussenii]